MRLVVRVVTSEQNSFSYASERGDGVKLRLAPNEIRIYRKAMQCCDSICRNVSRAIWPREVHLGHEQGKRGRAGIYRQANGYGYQSTDLRLHCANLITREVMGLMCILVGELTEATKARR